jgi:hypothetical protein
MVITGTREWNDYSVQTVVTPHLVEAFGLAARVQGQERYYALLLCGQNTARLVKRLDGETVIAEQDFAWQFGQPYNLRLDVRGNRISAWVNDTMLFTAEDTTPPLAGGGIALLCESGRIGAEQVKVTNDR